MKRQLKKFETIMWMIIKWMLYIVLMFIFMSMMQKNNIALTRPSRTLGITYSTFVVCGLLFVSIYGKYDIGRRKSKPIIISLGLATFFTDIITYIQLMIMNTITPSIYAFELSSISNLVFAFLYQIIVIAIFVYGGNALFFLIHKPEKSCIITSSQESLDQAVRAIQKYKLQYDIAGVFDYRDKMLLRKTKDYDAVFIYDIPIQLRTELVKHCYKTRKNVYFNPEIEDIVETSSEFYILDDITMLNYNVKGLTMEQRIVKRLTDVVFSFISLIILSPILLLSALSIKIFDKGPVFFTQDRATINGKIFKVVKFRTMKVGVENRSVSEDDDRITKPGKILRKFRLDELPQLWNIFRGDMSFVGPRPEMVENVEAYTEELPEFSYRLRVKAGLTGYAQIFGKYNTSPKDKLIMDMMYIENFNIFKDIQLLFQTAIVLLKKDSTEGFHDENKQRKYIFEEVKEEEII